MRLTAFNEIKKVSSELKFISMSRTENNTTINFDVKPKKFENSFEDNSKDRKEIKPMEIKAEPDMKTFLQRMFSEEEAAHYAEVLRGLGATDPKHLPTISQETLLQSGVRKFHARKIGSAEIYRAFL